MASIAATRFFGVFFPYSFKLTRIRSTLAAVAVWVFVLALYAPPLAGVWGQMGFEPHTFRYVAYNVMT